jgi:hypothetical protein
MVASRTIRTLLALIAAMTVGSLALILMETAPVRPPVTHLAAVAGPTDDSVDVISRAAIRVGKWRNIVVHTSVEGLDPQSECHFIVRTQPSADGGYAQATALWNRQVDGNHVFVPGYTWNSDSIGICLDGDFSRTAQSPRQFQSLMGLVRSLQQTCGITADRVYLNRDIDPRSASPGPAFPAELFNSNLLKPR